MWEKQSSNFRKWWKWLVVQLNMIPEFLSLFLRLRISLRNIKSYFIDQHHLQVRLVKYYFISFHSFFSADSLNVQFNPIYPLQNSEFSLSLCCILIHFTQPTDVLFISRTILIETWMDNFTISSLCSVQWKCFLLLENVEIAIFRIFSWLLALFIRIFILSAHNFIH